MKLILIFPLFLIASCQFAPKQITGPDGTPHLLVSCYSIESCYEDATLHCGGKYQIVNTSNEVSGGPDSSSSTTKLLVKCQK